MNLLLKFTVNAPTVEEAVELAQSLATPVTDKTLTPVSVVGEPIDGDSFRFEVVLSVRQGFFPDMGLPRQNQ